MGNRPPAQWLSPTIGTVLRLVFGAEYFRLQFISVAVGLAWFSLYRWYKRRNWNWVEQLPLVLLVSFVTAPYGAWPFDMVVLLPAVLVLLVKSRTAWNTDEGFAIGSPRFTVAGLVMVNVGCLVMNLCHTGSFWFIWVSPAVLALYALHARRASAVLSPRPALVAVPA
jgi:hypothetical protein